MHLKTCSTLKSPQSTTLYCTFNILFRISGITKKCAASLLFLSFFVVNAQTQNDKIISCDFGKIRIDNFLDSLNKYHNYNFSYSPSFLPSDSTINTKYSIKSIEYILNDIFKNQDPKISVSGNQIVLKPNFRELEVNNFVTIEGVIQDKENLRPMPFVNISIFGEPIGTISNKEGYYKFLVPEEYKNSKLIFSSVGYKMLEITVPAKDSVLNIDLNRQSINLKEIEVKYLKANEIIDKVCDNIGENYFTTPLLLSGFFRETIKQDGKFIEVSEAVIDIYKSSYLKPMDSEKVRFVKGRKTIDERDVPVARLKLQGGPLLFSNIDIVKHLDFLPINGVYSYQYTYLGKAIEHGRLVFRVGFKPYTENDDIYYNGDFNIDAENFAIISANFQLTKKTLRKSDKYLIRKDARKIKSIPTFTKYHISYRPVGDKWILNRVKGEIKIRMLDKRQKRLKSFYQATAELLITDAIDGKKQKIKYSETFKPNYVLSDQIKQLDIDFWKNYNVINPEDEIQKVLKNNPVEINIVPKLEKAEP